MVWVWCAIQSLDHRLAQAAQVHRGERMSIMFRQAMAQFSPPSDQLQLIFPLFCWLFRADLSCNSSNCATLLLEVEVEVGGRSPPELLHDDGWWPAEGLAPSWGSVRCSEALKAQCCHLMSYGARIGRIGRLEVFTRDCSSRESQPAREDWIKRCH